MTIEDDPVFDFPCEFPIKAIGKAIENLDALVFSIVHRHAPDLSEGAVKVRPSRKENYMSVTVTITATSRAQLEAIYQDLADSPHIILAM